MNNIEKDNLNQNSEVIAGLAKQLAVSLGDAKTIWQGVNTVLFDVLSTMEQGQKINFKKNFVITKYLRKAGRCPKLLEAGGYEMVEVPASLALSFSASGVLKDTLSENTNK